MPDYIYKTSAEQRYRNNDGNELYNQLVTLGVRKISRIFHVDNETAIKCAYAFVPALCHLYLPSCDGTKREYKAQKICRETCFNLIRICGWKIWDLVVKYATNNNPYLERESLIRCKILPYRNAGDSPECWYSDFKESAGNIRMR